VQPKDSSGISPPSTRRRRRGVARPPSAEAAASARDDAKGGGEGKECDARQRSCVILREEKEAEDSLGVTTKLAISVS
jgi:hypothetical protein